jgi:hypothetical protein
LQQLRAAILPASDLTAAGLVLFPAIVSQMLFATSPTFIVALNKPRTTVPIKTGFIDHLPGIDFF